MRVDVLNTMSPETVTDGVSLYTFTPDNSVACGQYTFERSSSDLSQLVLFFCCSGSFTLQRSYGDTIKVNREEILLLSNAAELTALMVQEEPCGCCLVIQPANCTAFDHILQTLGCTDWNLEQVQTLLQTQGGYLQRKHGSWNQSIFSLLPSLPAPAQGPYCLLKATELFYLLHTKQALYGPPTLEPAIPTHLVDLLQSVGAYIENHLEEKLTIPHLCRQFNLSPTTLKNKFREFYGQPIHRWILARRIRRAAALLQSTDLSILQIAQSVGYDSASQFNVVFRRVYSIPPSLYRKKVQSNHSAADSIGKSDFPMV